MDKMRIAVFCPSEIAFRRFMPALQKEEAFVYTGVAVAGADEWFGEGEMPPQVREGEWAKAKRFQEEYGGRIYSSYRELLDDPENQAVYLPLPPALHFPWAREVLLRQKHLLAEKPFTTALKDTKALLELSAEMDLAVHENYMFRYHSQIAYIRDILEQGTLGEIRLMRLSFGFPFRGAKDFRYNKALGGGALLDCGGYTLKLASLLLGPEPEIKTAQLGSKKGLEVDLYGSATLVDREGTTVQLAFGMDNSYRCSLEIWGSQGELLADRIFTAPAGFQPQVTIKTGGEQEQLLLAEDDTFFHSIHRFYESICQEEKRRQAREEILLQSRLVEEFLKKAERTLP